MSEQNHMNDPTKDEQSVLHAAQAVVLSASKGLPLDADLGHLVASTSKLPVARMSGWESAFQSTLWVRAPRWPPFRSRAKDRPFEIPWLGLVHPDGFIRERTLWAADEGAPSAFLFALAVRRMNDWVPQVRAAAREAVPRMGRRTDPDRIVQVLWWVLPQLSRWGRIQPEDMHALTTLLDIDGVSVRLAEELIRRPAGPAASVLGQAGRSSALDASLEKIAQAAVQPSVRSRAYRSLLERRACWIEGWKWGLTDVYWGKGKYEPVIGTRALSVACSTPDILAAAVEDASPSVRRVAGDFLLAHVTSLGTEGVELGTTLSEDVYPSVAHRGRLALEKVNEHENL